METDNNEQSPLKKHYTYEPLKHEHSLRLLRIEPGANSTLHFTLEQKSPPFEESPADEYSALSYCWGDEAPSCEIQVNGYPFWVTPNLFAALNAIAEHGILEVWLWIDAICLNQHDLIEKSAQVRRMNQIYQEAAVVLVWLGDEAHDSQSVMDVILCLDLRESTGLMDAEHELYDRAKADLAALTSKIESNYDIYSRQLDALESYLVAARQLGGHPTKQPLEAILNEPSIRDALMPPNHLWWKSLLHLIHRPWFYRVWTLQEIVLAKRAIVLCGKALARWKILRDLRKIFPVTLDLFTWDDLIEALGSRISFGMGYSDVGYRVDLSPGTEMLRVLLLTNPSRGAQDPRDYIYGYLGLLGSDVRPDFTIDYERPPEAVFIEAFGIASQGNGGPEFASQILDVNTLRSQLPFLSLPTWCPDFSSRLVSEMNPYGPGIIAKDVCPPKANKPVILMSDKKGLQVFGIALDTVQTASQTALLLQYGDYFVDGDSSLIRQLSLAEEWLHNVVTMLAQHGNCEDLKQLWLQQYAYERLPEDLPQYDLQTLLETSAILARGEPKTFKEASLLLKTSGWSPQEARKVVTVVVSIISDNKGRYFFVSETGKLGFGMKPVLPGQHICYFPGGSLLKILSRDCDQYITSASVHGFMGEKLLPVLAGGENFRYFTLY